MIPARLLPQETRTRHILLQAVQLVFGAACVAVAAPLIIQLGPAVNVANETSVRILGGALLAMALGAFTSAREPWKHRVVLRMEIVFTGLTAVLLVHRLFTHEAAGNRAIFLLPPVVVCLVLLLTLYPRAEASADGRSDGRSG